MSLFAFLVAQGIAEWQGEFLVSTQQERRTA